MERISRRGFLEIGAWTTALCAIAVADTAFEQRIGQEKHPLNDDVNFILGLQAKTIASHITFRNFEFAKSMGASGYNVIPKPEGFARMLLAMAYYEDGQEGVGKTLKAVSKKGLEIVLDQTPSGTEASFTNPLFTPGKPYTITVDPKYLLTSPSPLIHEEYHAHQFIRDGEGKALLIQASLVIGAFSSLYFLVRCLADHDEHLSRRGFLNWVTRFGISSALLFKVLPILNPYEKQAYTQTNGIIPDTLAADPFFQFNSTDLFDFQK